MIGIKKPKLMTCWFCEEPNKAAAFRDGRAVCAKCDTLMTQGVICIGVNEAITRNVMIDKFYRDGNWCVLSRDEFVRRFGYLPAERFEYVPSTKWQKAALPRFGKHGASHGVYAGPVESLDALDDDHDSDNDNLDLNSEAM